MLVGGGIGEHDKRTPGSIIDEGPQRTVYRYLDPERRRRGVPVLLVPPLAAPATCMDLRPGCSLARHLLAAGHATYLVDYGDITFSDRELGLEHWVEEVIPRAARIVSEDAGGQPVALVGWCLGGIMSLLAVAGDPKIPVGGVTTIASPFDFRRIRLIAPLRPVDDLVGGQLVSAAYRLLGGAPAPLVRYAYRAAALDKQILSRGRSSPTSTTASSWPRSRRWTRSWHGCTPTPAARSASSTTASSASTSWPAPSRRWAIGRSTSPTRTSPYLWWRARATASRHGGPCSTWPSWCPTRPTSDSRPRRAATSACSPAARRAARHGSTSTSSSTRSRWRRSRKRSAPRPPSHGLAISLARQGARGRYARAMGRTPLVIALVGAVVLAAPAVAGGADARIIAAGTSAGGVVLSGLTIDEAAGRLDTEFAPKLATPVVVAVAGRQFSLASSRAQVKFDPRTTAERAFYQGRTGLHDVPLAIEHSDDAVRAFVHEVDGRVGHPARNARVRITLKRMVRVR